MSTSKALSEQTLVILLLHVSHTLSLAFPLLPTILYITFWFSALWACGLLYLWAIANVHRIAPHVLLLRFVHFLNLHLHPQFSQLINSFCAGYLQCQICIDTFQHPHSPSLNLLSLLALSSPTSTNPTDPALAISLASPPVAISTVCTVSKTGSVPHQST